MAQIRAAALMSSFPSGRALVVLQAVAAVLHGPEEDVLEGLERVLGAGELGPLGLREVLDLLAGRVRQVLERERDGVALDEDVAHGAVDLGLALVEDRDAVADVLARRRGGGWRGSTVFPRCLSSMMRSLI
jgi:hypothetical protein